MKIPYELKRECVEACKDKTHRQIYNEIFLPRHSGMSYESFSRKLRLWKKQQMADKETLAQGTYEGFIAHNATVQVDSAGNIRQAWIKQGKEEDCWEQIIEAIKKNIEPIDVLPTSSVTEQAMLELPLFDMHFGIATLDNYMPVLCEILTIIHSKRWEEINVIVGQDLLHTNDLRGHTAKGTAIQQIDFGKAWRDAWRFWTTIIDLALKQSPQVNIRYSKGNHDECTSWCFVQALKARYPRLWCDDSFEARRCILWRNCFIGYGHCEYTGSLSKIFQNFVMDFPQEFASAKVREIHTGHLHSEGQDNGIMVRRLASAVPADEWTRNNGYIGSHKRFQLFEWNEGKLKAIYYV